MLLVCGGACDLAPVLPWMLCLLGLLVIACHGACDGQIRRGRPPSDPNGPTRKIGDTYGPWGYCRACAGWVPAEGLFCFCCGGRVRRKPRGCKVARDLRYKDAARAEREAKAGSSPAPAASAMLEVAAA